MKFQFTYSIVICHLDLKDSSEVIVRGFLMLLNKHIEFDQSPTGTHNRKKNHMDRFVFLLLSLQLEEWFQTD